MNAEPIVFVVDDDVAVRDSVTYLLEAEGHRVEAYASGADFLERYRPEHPGCLLLDISMPGLSGLEVQQQLTERGSCIPIIFLTGRSDYQIVKRAYTAGAFAFLDKPADFTALIVSVREALAEDRKRRGG